MDRRSLYLAIIMMVVFIVIGCSKEQKGKELEVTVAWDFLLSEEAQKHLHRMSIIALDYKENNEIAFSNPTSPIGIVVTDYDGKFVEKIGKEGRGPDEVMSTRNFGFDGDGNMVILDKPSSFFKSHDRLTGDVHSFEYPIQQGVHVTSQNLEYCKDKWYLAIQLLGRAPYPRVPIVGVFNKQFSLVDTLGGYDPFFDGRASILQEPVISVDCSNNRIYTGHLKTPYIQVYSMDNYELIGRTKEMPPKFMLSEKFITMVTNPTEMIRFQTEEQSLSLMLATNDRYIFHIYRNDNYTKIGNRYLNERNHYVAVYNKENLSYIGYVKVPGAILGSTKDGYLIMIRDEASMQIQFLDIKPKEIN